MRRPPLLHPAVAALAMAAAACGSSGGGNGTMSVHLVDGPADYQEIDLDIRTVEIHSGASGWIELGSPGKIVNLLALTGGVDETLVDGVGLPAGHYDQMRLVLGAQNSVTLRDGSVHDLKVPSGMQSGVKLNVSFDVAPNTTKDVFIDFDAHRSIFLHGAGNSGKYLLRPVVFAVDKLVTGAITGVLTDDAAAKNPLPGAVVTAQTVAGATPSIVRTVKTGADGRYTLDLLPIDATYYVVAQPVVGTTVYLARSSPGILVSAANPTPAYEAAFSATASFGTLGGTITPPLGADESDVVSLIQPLDVGGATKPLIVDTAAGAFDGVSETYQFTNLPVGPYSAVVTRQGEDASGNPTFQSSAPVAVSVVTAGTTLNLGAP